MFTIKVRIVIAYTLLFGLMLGGFAFMIYHAMQQAEIDRLDGQLESHADKVETEIEEQLGDGRFPIPADFQSLTTASTHPVQLQLYASGKPLLPAQPPTSNLTLPSVIPASPDLNEYTAAFDRGDYRVLAYQPAIGKQLNLTILLAVSTEEVEEELASLRLLFGIAIPLSLLLAATAAFLIIRSAFRPMTRIIETARNITAEDLDKRVVVPAARDEIRDLAETLNGMIARLAAAFHIQRQFVADASHEIRTPLTIIRTELEYAERTDEMSNARDSIRIALSETDNLALMANSLLLLVRLEGAQNPLRLELVDLGPIVLSAIERLSKVSERKEIRIASNLANDVVAEVDPEKLERALMNLLDNAVKYSNPGTAIQVALARQDSTAIITVIDHGIGISVADLPRIFDRFHRSNNVHDEPGHGLGLAIVRRVVELHRGSVSVESAPGQGSRFTILLPLS